MCEQHIKQGVRGISTRKVYPFRQLPVGIVRSYRTFSPLSASWRTVIFCDTFYAPELLRELHPLGGAALCVVQTFLP